MITLKNVHEHSMQDVFDKIGTHLLKQGKRSENNDHCQYRTKNGLQCAIGCLITDDEYSEDMEGETVYGLNVAEHLSKKSSRKLVSFLTNIQLIHDVEYVEDWHSKLTSLANEYNLSTDAIDRVKKGKQ